MTDYSGRWKTIVEGGQRIELSPSYYHFVEDDSDWTLLSPLHEEPILEGKYVDAPEFELRARSLERMELTYESPEYRAQRIISTVEDVVPKALRPRPSGGGSGPTTAATAKKRPRPGGRGPKRPAKKRPKGRR